MSRLTCHRKQLRCPEHGLLLVWHETDYGYPDQQPQGLWVCPGRMTKSQIAQMAAKYPGTLFTESDACQFHIHPDELTKAG